MRKIATALALSVFIINPAMADADSESICLSVKEASEAVMGGRLAGVPVDKSMAILGIDKMYKAMIYDAYTSYDYKTDEYKQSAIRDFGAKYYLDCMRRASR